MVNDEEFGIANRDEGSNCADAVGGGLNFCFYNAEVIQLPGQPVIMLEYKCSKEYIIFLHSCIHNEQYLGIYCSAWRMVGVYQLTSLLIIVSDLPITLSIVGHHLKQKQRTS